MFVFPFWFKVRRARFEVRQRGGDAGGILNGTRNPEPGTMNPNAEHEPGTWNVEPGTAGS